LATNWKPNGQKPTTNATTKGSTPEVQSINLTSVRCTRLLFMVWFDDDHPS
jgi:hypothetical protein